MLRRIADGVAYGFELLAEAALVVLLALVAHEVFRRYLLNDPTQYSVEYSEYLLVLISFFAAAYVLRCDRHVRVAFVVDALSPRWQALAALISQTLLLVFCVVLVSTGAGMSWTAMLGGERSSSLVSFPMWIPYAFVPLGGVALGLQCLARIVDAAAQFRAAAGHGGGMAS